MDSWPWTHLNQYCLNPTNRAWVADQLVISPIPPGQSPEDWLLVRSMVSEGRTEAEAWNHVFQQNAQNGSTDYAHDFLTQPYQDQYGAAATYNLGDAIVTPQNGFYQASQPYGGSQLQAPCEFVNLQDITPQGSYSTAQPGLSLGHSNPSNPQIHYNGLPSHFVQATSTLPIQDAPAPTINPAQLLASASLDKPTSLPSKASESPFKLGTTKPDDLGRGRSASPMNVVKAPGRKRPVSPLRSAVSGSKATLPAKKPARNSSSIDPPSPPVASSAVVSSGNGQPGGSASRAAGAVAPSKVTIETLRPLLGPDALKQPKPVALFKNLRKRKEGDKDLPPIFTPTAREVREICVQLKDYASSAYLKVMSDDVRYCDVWEDWLEKASRDPERWEVAIPAIFQVLARTEMILDDPKEYTFLLKLARRVADAAETKALASKGAIQAAYQKYRSYIVDVLRPKTKQLAEERESREGADKKRKIDDVAGQAGKPGPSKVANASERTTPTASTSGNSKAGVKNMTDMSFFSAKPATAPISSSRPKPKLPEFKKVDRSSAIAIPPATSGPSAGSSLLSSTLQALTRGAPTSQVGRNSAGSSSTSVQPDRNTPEVEKAEPKAVKYTKKGKMIIGVRFRDLVKDVDGGGALEQVKLFKEEPWEFETPFWQENEEGGENVHGYSAHQLDVAEGAALAASRGHGMIDWYEPDAYIEHDADFPPLTPEVEAQNERERGILAIAYPPGIPIPNPTEIDVRVVEPQDAFTRIMDPENDSAVVAQVNLGHGASIDSARYGGTAAPAPVPQTATSVTDLLRNLTGLQNVIPPVTPSNSYGVQSHQPYGYNQPQPYQQQQNQGWGYNTPASQDSRSSWGGNTGYARPDYETSTGSRPLDRDTTRPICRFWARGE
ncbi:hypothetical protein IAU60_000425 [Kwoniella sp. DSM 27419]